MLAFLPALLQLAPALAGLIAGKNAEQAATKAVQIAQAVTGAATGEDAVAALQADPAKALEFQKAVMDNKLEFAKLDLAETQAFLADKASARDRDVQYVKAGRNNLRGDVLAYCAIGSLVAVILLLFVFKVPQESRELLLVVLGSLVTIVKDVFSFEFGSSKDSQRNAQAVVDVLKSQ